VIDYLGAVPGSASAAGAGAEAHTAEGRCGCVRAPRRAWRREGEPGRSPSL